MTGFAKLFWGFLFVLLDFRIQGFDIFPDIVGYLLIYSGLGQLIVLNPHFQQARKYALPLTILSIFDLVQFQQPVSQFNFEPSMLLYIVLGTVITVIDLLMVYHLCTGIAKAAIDINQTELEMTAMNRWKYYLYSKIALIILIPLVLVAPGILLILGIPLLIVTLIIAVLIMTLMKRADQTFYSTGA
ncbi:MAG: hypothetical protein ACYC21_09905 [Eubacteriales bacterium]